MSQAPELPYCRNCRYTLATPRPRFCGHCGQETDLHPPSVREMGTEYLGHYVALDGPLWRTLWTLLALPGQLTLEYFHGRRRHFVLPLRVYLTASFLFFVGSHLLPHDAHEAPDGPDDSPPAVVAKEIRRAEKVAEARLAEAASAASGAMADPDRGRGTRLRPSKSIERCALPDSTECNVAERAISRAIAKANLMSRDQWMAKLTGLAPYGMLAMQPVYAALLLLMFAGSGRRYAEHFVFSLHSHSMWFLAMLFATLTGTEGAMLLAVFWHGLASLRRVYALAWPAAVWRGLLLSLGYFVLLVLGLVVLALLAAMTA